MNGDDHFSSKMGVGGLLNTDKLKLVCLILDNLEVFHRHHRQLGRYVQPGDCAATGGFVHPQNNNSNNDGSPGTTNGGGGGGGRGGGGQLQNSNSMPNVAAVLNVNFGCQWAKFARQNLNLNPTDPFRIRWLRSMLRCPSSSRHSPPSRVRIHRLPPRSRRSRNNRRRRPNCTSPCSPLAVPRMA